MSYPEINKAALRIERGAALAIDCWGYFSTIFEATVVPSASVAVAM